MENFKSKSEKSDDFLIKLVSKLSFEERKYLKQFIKNKRCINCSNGNCRVEYSEKMGLNEYGEPQGSNCIGWNNPVLIGKQKALMQNNNRQ